MVVTAHRGCNILTRWGAVKLADITHEQIARWIAELRGSGLSASTVRQIHRVFSLVLALAVRDGRLARNPADGVPLPRATPGERIFLTHDQLDALADAAGRERLVILFLGYTGVRYGEMAALRIRNLDLIKRRALIAEAVADVNGRAVFDTPKNHQRRAVPLPRFLADERASTSGATVPTTTSSLPRRAACCTCATFVATASTRRYAPPPSTV